MTYRPEIDGLRAIAVAAVVLFHAGFPAFGGGFVGVDVFFVISGFLITSIIVGDLRSGTFSLTRFYERRARRILPALFVVMAACVPFAYTLLSPDDLKDFAQSLAAISLFASNILFWGESGYFDTQTDLKPLLHTWSLAVEEQFYVAFPLLAWAVCRLGVRWLPAVIAVVGAGSLAVSVREVPVYPSAAFYLLPSRAWELLVGSLAAFFAEGRTCPSERGDAWRALADITAAVGLGMIAFSIFGYQEQTPFPGRHALPPTLGAVLVLLFASQETLVGRVLAWRPLVALGLISYSVYLWHQPLFAFTKHALLDDIPPALAAVLCMATLVLGYLSWRFIEQPFRDRGWIGRGGVFAFSLAGMLVFIGLGAVGHQLSDRITALRLRGVDPSIRDTIRTRESLVAERNAFVAGFLPSASQPFSSDPGARKILILGDSVSEDLYAAVMVDASLFPGVEFRRIPLDETCMASFATLVATETLPKAMDEGTCREAIERLGKGSLFHDASMIVLCANWPRYITHSTHEGAMALAEALAARGREVAIVGLMSMQEASSTAFVAVGRGLSSDQANRFAYGTIQRSKIDKPNADARALAERLPAVRYLDKYAVFSDDAARTMLLYDDMGRILFADNFHLTRAGGVYFGRRIAALGWFDEKIDISSRHLP